MEITFNNSHELLKYCEAREQKVRDYTKRKSQFTHDKTYEDLVKGLKFGVKDYNTKLLKNLTDVESTQEHTNDYFYTDDGLFYDIQEVLNGTPECMLDVVQEERKQIVVKIDFAYQHYVEKDVINTRGAAVFKLLYTLLCKDYNCEIEFSTKAIKSYQEGAEPLVMHFKLPKNELNIPTIAYYCSEEFFRLVTCFILEENGFKLCESKSDKDYRPDNCLFIPAGYTDKKTHDFKNQKEADEYVKQKFEEYLR